MAKSQEYSRHMRVLMVAPAANPGGQPEILYNLATCLPRFGVTPLLVALQTGPLVDRLGDAGVDVRLIRAGRVRQTHRLINTWRQLMAEIAVKRPDVVFSNEAKGHLYAGPAARFCHIPALWCQPGYPQPPSAIDRLATALPAVGVIAESRDAAAAQRRLNVSREVHIMHPGVDTTRFRPASDPNLRQEHGIAYDEVLVSLVGRLQPWKGQRQFLHAAASLVGKYPRTRFAVVGGAVLGTEGSYPDELRQLTRALELEANVIFTGHTDTVHRWMAASDVVVNASDPEPFGLVIVEAMACSCAVVAVGRGGPRDIVEHSYSGILCPDGQPASLADGIAMLLENPSLRTSVGLAGRKRVEDLFTREAMTRAFVDILHRSVV
jgi:glycosyltransferase involved in cell wall biosynthesis